MHNVDVPSLRCALPLIRTVKPEASWASTLQGAEFEANKLAKEHLQEHQCKQATIQALAGHQYRWQASDMSAFDNQRCVVLPQPEGGLLNTVCSVDRGTRWTNLSREEQLVELTTGITRLAWKSAHRATAVENTSKTIAQASTGRSSFPSTARLQRFNLADAVARDYHNGKNVAHRIPIEEVDHKVLSGDSPASVVSADGYRLIVHLPGGLRGKTLVRCRSDGGSGH